MIARSHLTNAAMLGCCAAALSTAAFSAPETRFSVQTTGALGYSKNPFVTTGSSTGSAFVEGTIAPEFDILTSNSVLSLTANYNHQQYFDRYGGSDAYGAGISYSRSFSSRLSVNAQVGFDSSISGQGYGLLGGIALPSLSGATGTGTSSGNTTNTTTNGSTISGALPTFVDGVGNDYQLLGTLQRRNALSGSAGVNYALDARNSVDFGVSASRVRYPGSTINTNDFHTLGGHVGYQRRLSSRSTVGLQVSVSQVHYENLAFPNTLILSPQLTYQTKFNDRWSLNAAAGVSINRQDALGGARTTNSPSANLGVCREGNRTNICLSVSRAAYANGFSGVQNETSAALTYMYKLNERTTFNGQATYGRTSGGNGSLGTRSTQFYGLSGSLDRTLNRRMKTGISGFYRNTSEPVFNDRPADLGGRLFISYMFGDIK